MTDSVARDVVSLAAIKEASPGSVTTTNVIRVVLIEDDDNYRQALAEDLSDRGFSVQCFADGATLLQSVGVAVDADVVLLDWRLPQTSGIDLLPQMRRRGINLPVVFLTGRSLTKNESLAFDRGAIDFIDKARGVDVLVKRLRLIAEGARPVPEADGKQVGDILHLGRLELRFDINRASWAGTPIDLTLTEFKIVALLALRTGEDVSYREIYDLVHGKNFVAGYGDEGYRANVRTFIKRIRKKLRDVDPEFEHIHNYAGFGYRWLANT